MAWVISYSHIYGTSTIKIRLPHVFEASCVDVVEET